MPNKQEQYTVDMTPSWVTISRILIAVLQNPNASHEVTQDAEAQIRWMAEVIDALNVTFKRQEPIIDWSQLPLRPTARLSTYTKKT